MARHKSTSLLSFSPLICVPCDSTGRDCRDIRITSHPPLEGGYQGVQQSVSCVLGGGRLKGSSRPLNKGAREVAYVQFHTALAGLEAPALKLGDDGADGQFIMDLDAAGGIPM